MARWQGPEHLAEENGHGELTQPSRHHLVTAAAAAFFPFTKAVFIPTLGGKNQVS